MCLSTRSLTGEPLPLVAGRSSHGEVPATAEQYLFDPRKIGKKRLQQQHIEAGYSAMSILVSTLVHDREVPIQQALDCEGVQTSWKGVHIHYHGKGDDPFAVNNTAGSIHQDEQAIRVTYVRMDGH